jgi:hypothetical protein
LSYWWVVNCPYCNGHNIDDLGNRLSKDGLETVWDLICLDCNLDFEAIEPVDWDKHDPLPLERSDPTPNSPDRSN